MELGQTFQSLCTVNVIIEILKRECFICWNNGLFISIDKNNMARFSTDLPNVAVHDLKSS
jgi:hypothetical protein